MSELGENGAVLSLDETDGAQLPDLKDVAEIARTQFVDMLASEEGKKDLVIQGELMTLLEHVTPINFLKKYSTLHLCVHKFHDFSLFVNLVVTHSLINNFERGIVELWNWALIDLPGGPS